MPRKPIRDHRADLPEQWHEELSNEALEKSAGNKVYVRGQAYFAQGKAQLARDGGGNTTWDVRGTQPYAVELYFEDGGLHADCTCPYADDEGFCKHIVAAGLAWRAHLGGSPEAEAEGPLTDAGPADAAGKSAAAVKRAATIAAKYESLRSFVDSRGASELAQRLWAWAEQDRDRMADLRAWQAEADAASRPGAWKEALAELLKKTRDYYDWDDSRRYAERGEKVLPLLRALAASSPTTALEACVAALTRVFKIGEHADDSGGHIGDLADSLHDVLLDALRTAPPKGQAAERWLDAWLKLQERDPWGLSSDLNMVEAAGLDVAERYSKRVASDWADWLRGRRSHASSAPVDPYDSVRQRLRYRYLDDLRQRGDGAGVLEVLRSDPQGAHECLELAEHLEAMGREREALRELEAARKQYPDDWRLDEALLHAYERDGCVQEALGIHRRRLERRPDVAAYAATLTAASAAGRDAPAYRAELHQWAAGLEQQDGMPRRSASPESRAARDVTVRLRWLTYEQRFDEALELTRSPGAQAPENAWLELAQAMSKTHRKEAADILERILRNHMRYAQAPYREPLALAHQWLGLLDEAKARERLASLQAEYRAKRTFVAGLNALRPA